MTDTQPMILDLSVLNGLREIEASLVEQVVEAFLSSAPDDISKMERAVKEQNAKELALAAHSLKSASASVGAMAVSHYCFKLEMMGKGGNVASAADDLFRCLNDSFKAAQVELEKQK